MVESIVSMVRIVTTVFEGMVTLIGCGGGGGAGCGGGVAIVGAAGAGATAEGFAPLSSALFGFEAAPLSRSAARSRAASRLRFERSRREGAGGGVGAEADGGGSGAFCDMVAAAAGAAMVVESITCFTPSVWEEIRSAASRAASSGTWPVRVTMLPLVATLTDEAFSKGSEYILA